MAGLLDIAPAKESVIIRGTPVEVTGVSIKGVAHLLGRFPDLRKLMSGQEIGIDRIMNIGGDVVSAIIAAGTGALGDENAEAVAASLSIDEQVDLLTPIMKRTLPQGAGPFVEKLGLLGLGLNEGSSAGNPNAPTTSPSALNS